MESEQRKKCCTVTWAGSATACARKIVARLKAKCPVGFEDTLILALLGLDIAELAVCTPTRQPEEEMKANHRALTEKIWMELECPDLVENPREVIKRVLEEHDRGRG